MEQIRIVVVYEDGVAREHALRAAPELAEPIQPETTSIAKWWSFDGLSDSANAAEAALRAAAADLVVFAFSPGSDLPRDVKLWIENWIAKRSEREGTIVGLVARHAKPGELACLKEIYLRHVAHRARMDYLSQIPAALAKTMPDSLDSYRERAKQITSVLDEILRSGLPPPPANL